MNARTEFQIVVGKDGKPAFVVVPYERFRRMQGGFTRGTVPDAVVDAAFDRVERATRPRKATLEGVAAALGIEAEQRRS